MSSTISIAPSLLSANFGRLEEEAKALTLAGADLIHLDIMDGHFVPNITFGPLVVEALRSHTNLPLEAHLMIAPADPYITAFANAGADIITVHPESGPHLHRTLQHIKALGKKAGVALNPTTPPDVIDYVLDLIDTVLIMTVNPGFGGQRFIESQCAKIQAVRQKIEKCNHLITLAVDGGINESTAKQVIAAGADTLVAGTAIFEAGPTAYADRIQALRNAR